MSEESKETPTKKKGKLPIIVVLAVVLAGGGFFVMKGKSGKKVETPKVVMGEKETELEEFLTNTATPAVYVRTKISVRLRKGYEETKFLEEVGDVRDAVISVLNSTPPSIITDASKRSQLKKTIAEAINTALEGPIEKAEAETPKDTEPKRAGKVTEKDPNAGKEAAHDEKPARQDDWDSQTGPVLKVRFSNLATQ